MKPEACLSNEFNAVFDVHLITIHVGLKISTISSPRPRSYLEYKNFIKLRTCISILLLYELPSDPVQSHFGTSLFSLLLLSIRTSQLVQTNNALLLSFSFSYLERRHS